MSAPPSTARFLAGCVMATLMAVAGPALSYAAADTATTAESPAEPDDGPSAPAVTKRAGQAEEAEGKVPDAGEKTPAGEQSSSSEVFVPSEEISEDFTVSFPVDI